MTLILLHFERLLDLHLSSFEAVGLLVFEAGVACK